MENQQDPVRIQREFGANVRSARNALGITQRELADRLAGIGIQMHQTAIAKIEAGTRPTTVVEARGLASMLGTPVSALVGLYEDDPVAIELNRLQTDHIAKIRDTIGARRQLRASALLYYDRRAKALSATDALDTYVRTSSDIAESMRSGLIEEVTALRQDLETLLPERLHEAIKEDTGQIIAEAGNREV